MLFEAFDRIAERKRGPLVFRSVLAGIIAGRVGATPISHQFNKCRTTAVPGSFCRPSGYCVHRQQIVAVDTDSGNAEAEPTSRERPAFSTGSSLEGRNGPLVVHNVENNGCLVDGGKRQCVVKVSFGGAAVANPGGGNMIFSLDRRGHGPSNSMRVLGSQVS